MMLRRERCTGQGFIEFARLIREKYRRAKRIYLILDNWRVHKSKYVEDEWAQDKMLKSYNDLDLSQRYYGKGDEIQKLVDEFFHFAWSAPTPHPFLIDYMLEGITRLDVIPSGINLASNAPAPLYTNVAILVQQ